jgi:hypothetical protein
LKILKLKAVCYRYIVIRIIYVLAESAGFSDFHHAAKKYWAVFMINAR